MLSPRSLGDRMRRRIRVPVHCALRVHHCVLPFVRSGRTHYVGVMRAQPATLVTPAGTHTYICRYLYIHVYVCVYMCLCSPPALAPVLVLYLLLALVIVNTSILPYSFVCGCALHVT